jgi:putative transposase
MSAALQLGPRHGVTVTCSALGVPRAKYYRRRAAALGPSPRRASPPRTVPVAERTAVLDVLHQPRFADLAVPQVYATLLEEGRYLCSARTMYRILDENAEVRERRDQLRHPHYAAPQLLATAPNQVWSWDITKLLGPSKWLYYYLYVVLDIYSRYVVGWMLAERESGTLAQKLIAEACRRECIVPGQLTIHADRGGPMRSKPLVALLAQLDVTRTHSRPHVSNDNPFIEAHFKTLKYRPEFPDRCGSFQHAHDVCGTVFPWYNHEHHHSALVWLTPADVHLGRAAAILARRGQTLTAAFAAHPERFPHGPPKVPSLPAAVWINPPHAAPGATLAPGDAQRSISGPASAVTGDAPTAISIQ